MLVKSAVPQKDHVLKQLPSKLAFHIEEYYDCFQTETSNCLNLGQNYIQGLFKTEAGKRNMERLNEELNLSGNGYLQQLEARHKQRRRDIERYDKTEATK
ncbi:hypothetical protein [Allochromatium tepidum]|uniref:Uncharacterized protein n=1 Tax=Allochromatium tepidum TaxID=553982 RepID=A0ABM7QRA2_9GAMM|nr:hypothetical protein [Allochromatium tepidum]BCU08484.1 hypothetical protein Atep_31610 [Allochromatium tepidum]